MTRDARLSALHRGGFGLPGPRFRLLGRPPSYNGGQLPCGSVQRAPRTQVVVPGGRGPCLPRRTVTSRRRRTPLPAPPSGSSPETPLNERGCESCSMTSRCSQECSWCVVALRRPPLWAIAKVQFKAPTGVCRSGTGELFLISGTSESNYVCTFNLLCGTR